MYKDNKSFFSIQGNNLSFETWYKWVFIGAALLLVFIVFMLKNVIRRRFDRGGRLLFFKSDIAMWRTVGYIGLSVTIFRTIMYIVLDYPLYWENIGLHFCRFLMIIMYIILIFGKVKWIRHLALPAIIGATLAFVFLNPSSEYVSYASGNNSPTVLDDFRKATGKNGFTPNSLERIFVKRGYSFFSQGFDSIWTIETLIGHISIMIIPMTIISAYGLKITNREIHLTLLMLYALLAFFWLVNIAMSYLPAEGWHSNFWYIGPDKSNDNSEALGYATRWPQNLLTFMLMGAASVLPLQYLMYFQNKFQPFKGGKFMIVEKSERAAASKEEYSVGFKAYIKTVRFTVGPVEFFGKIKNKRTNK